MIRDASIALALRVAGTALWLGYTVLLARFLPQADFGLVMYAINIVLIATPLATIGFEQAVLRFGSQYWAAGQKDRYAYLVAQARWAAALGGILCVLALLIGAFAGVSTPVTGSAAIAGLTGAAIFASAMMAVHRSALRSAGRLIEALVGFTVLRAVIPAIGSVLLAYYGWLTPYSALGLFAGALGVSMLFESWRLWALQRRSSGDGSGRLTDPAIGKTHFVTALGIWPGDAAMVLLGRIGGIIVGLVLGLEAAALYIAAERIAALGQFLTDAVRIAAGPKVARAARQAETEPGALQHAVRHASLLMFLAGSAGALGLAVLGYPLLWLLGPEYIKAYPVVLLLLLGQTSWTVLGPTAMVMNMTGLERSRSVGTVVAAFAAGGVAWIGASIMGISGAALGYAAVSWGMNAVFALIISLKSHLYVGMVFLYQRVFGGTEKVV